MEKWNQGGSGARFMKKLEGYLQNEPTGQEMEIMDDRNDETKGSRRGQK